MTKTIKCLIAGVAVTVSGIFGYWCWNEAEVAAYCERIAKFEKFAGGRYLGEELSYENTKAYGVKYSVVDGQIITRDASWLVIETRRCPDDGVTPYMEYTMARDQGITMEEFHAGKRSSWKVPEPLSAEDKMLKCDYPEYYWATHPNARR